MILKFNLFFSSTEKGQPGWPIGTIIGIIAAVLLIVVAVVGISVFLLKKRR